MYVVRLTRTLISNGAHQEIELSASGRCPLISIAADLALLISNRCGREGRGTEEMFIEREAREPGARPPIAAGPMITTRFGVARLFASDGKSGQAAEHGVR
jgi:hypothetical protein